MNESTSKEKILKKIRKALIDQTPQPFPNLEGTSNLFVKSQESLEITFAEEFTRVQGQFAWCENKTEFAETLAMLVEERKWKHLFCWDNDLHELLLDHNYKFTRLGKDLEMADAGITKCEALVARTGTVVLSAAQNSGRTLGIFPPAHIVVAYTNQLVFDIKDAIALLRTKYDERFPSMVNFATGPSRTADIEKTLVLGAHGPKETFVFLIDEESAGT